MELAGLCEAIVDCAHKTAPIDPDGEHYAVGTPAMRGNRIDLGEARRINKSTFDLWTSRLRPRAGDLLLAREAPVGPVVRIPEEENVAPGQRTVLLRPASGLVDPAFLYYALISPMAQAELQTKAAGSTVAHLNVADVRTFRLRYVPDLPEQREIAAILAAIDDRIAASESSIAAMHALMLALLGLVEARASLAALVDQVTTTVKVSEFDRELNVYSLPAFDDGGVPAVVARESVKSNKTLVEEPVVLISKLNPRIPRIWDVPSPAEGMSVASTEFVALRPKTVSTSVLWAALSQPWVSTDLAGLVAGTSGSHQRVKPADLLAREVPDTRQLSDGHAREVTGLGKAVQSVLHESQVLAATRDTLLPLLMSGNLRVKDATKQIEEVL